MPIPLALPMIPAIVEAVAAGGITAAGLAALYERLNSDDVTTRYREEFGDQLRGAMPSSTSSAPTRPSVPYSPIIEEYRYTPGDALQILGINPLDVAIDTRTETPYEAHPRTRFHSIVLDANGNPYSASTESRQSASAGNNPQNDNNKNKQDTTKYNFLRAPLTNGWRFLNSRPGDPMKNINPTFLRTFGEWGIPGGIGYGVYELFDNDNESRPTRIEAPQNPNNAQTDTRNFDGMNIPIDSLFNLL